MVPALLPKSFIKQYYEKLARSPQDLYKFYKDNSFFTYVDGVQDSDPVGGPEDIKAAVAKIPFLGCRVDLSEGSLDAQTSDGGVVIVVTGDLQLPGEAARHFVQTFFLDAQQNSPNPSYYVRNSVLRLLRNHAPSASTHSVETETTESVDESPVAPEPAATPAPAPAPVELKSASPAPFTEESVAAAPSPAVETEPEAESTNVTEEETPVDEAETPSSEVAAEPALEAPAAVNSGPLSYRDRVLAGAKAGAAPAPAPAPAPKKKLAPKPAAAPAPAAAASAETPVRHVLYVKLPDTATVEEFKAIFTPYGSVVHCDVLNPKGYGFVQMESQAAKEAVLANSGSLSLRGKPVSVEERNAGSSRGNGRSNSNNNGQRDGNRDRDGKARSYRNNGGDSNKGSSAGAGGENNNKEGGNKSREGRPRDNNREKSDSPRSQNPRPKSSGGDKPASTPTGAAKK